MKLFVDTWGWLTLDDRKALRHSAAKKIYRRRRAQNVEFVTTDFVLSETFTRLFSRRPFPEAKRFAQHILDMADQGYLRIEWITPARLREAWRLRFRYDDQPGISFTDLTSFAVMRELGVTEALTEDRDFRIGGFVTAP